MNPYQYIDNLSRFGSQSGFKPGLKRIEALLAPFGHPEQKLKVIHVAGSNGKGSTIAFLKSIYQEAGYKVGVYTSPHLIHFNERIEVNNHLINTKELTELIRDISPVVDLITKDSSIGSPTYFEFITALSLLYFSRQRVDLVLLEVGLGGRFDATNIISSPLASVITSISLEHTAILGDKIEDIAREKAGIIKKARPVFSGVKDKKALQVIKGIAAKQDAECTIIDEKYSYQIISSSLKGQRFILNYRKDSPERNNRVNSQGFKMNKKERDYEQKGYLISLLGEHQVRNAILALAVVNKLQGLYLVSEKAIIKGLELAFIPGRLEILKENPFLLVDGAHNPEGIETLVAFLKKEFGLKQKIYLIIGILKDKNFREMVKLLNFKDNIELIITQNTSKRALAPAILKEVVEAEGIINKIYSNLEEALINTLKTSSNNDFICVTGSLYTVAETKILLGRYKDDGIN